MSKVKTGRFKSIPFVKIYIPDTITTCWGGGKQISISKRNFQCRQLGTVGFIS